MDIKNIEKEILPLIDDFQAFINYIEDKAPILSVKKAVLGKKDSFALNQHMNFKKQVLKASYTQEQYLMIDFIFSLCVDGGLFLRGSDNKGKLRLIKTYKLDEYRQLNNLEKYVFILQAFWSKYETSRKNRSYTSITEYYSLMMAIAKSKPGDIITNESYRRISYCFSSLAWFTHNLKFLGFCDLEIIEGVKSKYDDSIKSIKPSKLGIEICKRLLTEGLCYWNKEELEYFLEGYKIKCSNKENKSLFEIISQVFPEGVVEKELEDKEINRKGVYIFKVALNKNLWRTVKLSHEHTFHELHIIIQRAYNFDNDHCYAFYTGTNPNTGKEIYAGNPMGVSDEYEELTIEEAELYKGQKLAYLFDFGDNWQFDITVTEFIENEEGFISGEILESKGSSPEQYPMWE